MGTRRDRVLGQSRTLPARLHSQACQGALWTYLCPYSLCVYLSVVCKPAGLALHLQDCVLKASLQRIFVYTIIITIILS